MTTYRLQLDDGHTVEIKAYSAGEAIEQCLWQNRGRMVKTCRSGYSRKELEEMQKINGRIIPSHWGLVWHDVPAHVAIHPAAPVPAKQKPAHRFQDKSAPMFDDAEIAAESARAKAKTESSPQ